MSMPNFGLIGLQIWPPGGVSQKGWVDCMRVPKISGKGCFLLIKLGPEICKKRGVLDFDPGIFKKGV